MAVDYTKLKVGDKVRYLGGDLANKGTLVEGVVYCVVGDAGGYAAIRINRGRTWWISEYNDHCFVLVDDEKSESTCKCACNNEKHVVSLAKEVAQLKCELADLRSEIQAQAFEDNERIERLTDDIVMLDERTQDAGITEPTPVRKVVYEYERYYE